MSTQLKYMLYGLIAIVFVTIAVIVYRMFWQFDGKEIKIYAGEEAAKYGDKEGVYAIIMEGVQNVLSSHTLTQQVLKTARKTKTDKEQLLVQAAIKQCIAYGYLPSK